MKKQIFLILIALFVLKANATIVYLDNSATTDASQRIYSTFDGAYQRCSDGDTIYVMGSVDSYGSISIEKPITLIGPGYFLTANDETQVNKKNANFYQISLKTGSNGTIIKGVSLWSNGIYDRIYIYNNIDDITIENCYISGIFIDDFDGSIYNNIQIKKNYFWYRGIGTGTGYYDGGILTNLVITNNIFIGGLYLSNGSSGIISNNLFKSSTLYIGTLSIFEIHNNILLATDDDDIVLPPIPDISISNNVSVFDFFGTANNNLAYANADDLFVGADNNTTDGQYQLGESSAALGAGQNGIDAGPFGGNDPYRLSGLPNLPNIYELSTGGFVSGNEMNVKIKIKQ